MKEVAIVRVTRQRGWLCRACQDNGRMDPQSSDHITTTVIEYRGPLGNTWYCATCDACADAIVSARERPAAEGGTA